MSAPLNPTELVQLDNLFARGMGHLTPEERQRGYELWILHLAAHDKAFRTIGGLHARIRHLEAQLKDREADLAPIPDACVTPSVCHPSLTITPDDETTRTS